MSGLLRNLLCFLFIGLMIGSLWMFAQSTTVPSIPPWRGGEAKPARVERASFQAARFEDDFDRDACDPTTTAAVDRTGDRAGDEIRRST
ncbi:hypothetical protein BH09PLA1_BH09PLA1_15820 [soil metagenome]